MNIDDRILRRRTRKKKNVKTKESNKMLKQIYRVISISKTFHL